MRRGGTLAVVLALLLAVPAAAVTTVVYTGRTNQHLAVRVVVRDGNLDYIKVKWVAKCRTNHIWRDKTYWRNRPEGPIERQGDAFSDSGRYVLTFKDGKAIFDGKLSGSFLPNNRIAGTHFTKVRVYNKRGKRIDVCKVKTGFSAKAG